MVKSCACVKSWRDLRQEYGAKLRCAISSAMPASAKFDLVVQREGANVDM